MSRLVFSEAFLLLARVNSVYPVMEAAWDCISWVFISGCSCQQVLMVWAVSGLCNPFKHFSCAVVFFHWIRYQKQLDWSMEHNCLWLAHSFDLGIHRQSMQHWKFEYSVWWPVSSWSECQVGSVMLWCLQQQSPTHCARQVQAELRLNLRGSYMGTINGMKKSHKEGTCGTISGNDKRESIMVSKLTSSPSLHHLYYLPHNCISMTLAMLR